MELMTDTGRKRTRVLTMLRKNVAGSRDQKYFLYFHEPGDVRGTAFLVWKYPEQDDDRWILIPAHWNLWLTARAVRPYYDSPAAGDGTFNLYLARRP